MDADNNEGTRNPSNYEDLPWIGEVDPWNYDRFMYGGSLDTIVS